jgi:hypothetical protein
MINFQSFWSRVNWDVFDTFYCYRFNSLIGDWNVVLVINSDSGSWNYWLFIRDNFELEKLFVNFWNNINWYVCYFSNIECVYFLRWIDWNNWFSSSWFNSMNRNESGSINNNLFVSSMSDWLVSLSINFNSMFFSVCFCDRNLFISENRSVNFWNDGYWNVCVLSFLECMNWAFRFVLNCIFDSFSVFNLLNR